MDAAHTDTTTGHGTHIPTPRIPSRTCTCVAATVAHTHTIVAPERAVTSQRDFIRSAPGSSLKAEELEEELDLKGWAHFGRHGVGAVDMEVAAVAVGMVDPAVGRTMDMDGDVT